MSLTLVQFRRVLLPPVLLCLGGFAALSVRVSRDVREMPGASGSQPRASLRSARAAVPEYPSGDVFFRAGREQFETEARNYRLAGTFQTYVPEGDAFREGTQLALVDDIRTARQMMVRTGERVGPFAVAEIRQDQVVLSHGNEEWVLTLPGLLATRTAAAREPGGELDDTPRRFEDMPALETTPFGHRIAENQWVISRDAIFAYADQLMADPRRAINLYRSFTSVVPETEEDMAGFRLKMAGEREFFQSMGLADGDVIHKVNSMEMKNQERAEYLVSEFMRSRMSAVVLDIERNGQMEKKVFVIR